MSKERGFFLVDSKESSFLYQTLREAVCTVFAGDDETRRNEMVKQYLAVLHEEVQGNFEEERSLPKFALTGEQVRFNNFGDEWKILVKNAKLTLAQHTPEETSVTIPILQILGNFAPEKEPASPSTHPRLHKTENPPSRKSKSKLRSTSKKSKWFHNSPTEKGSLT